MYGDGTDPNKAQEDIVGTFKNWPWTEFSADRLKARPLPFIGQVRVVCLICFLLVSSLGACFYLLSALHPPPLKKNPLLKFHTPLLLVSPFRRALSFSFSILSSGATSDLTEPRTVEALDSCGPVRESESGVRSVGFLSIPGCQLSHTLGVHLSLSVLCPVLSFSFLFFLTSHFSLSLSLSSFPPPPSTLPNQVGFSIMEKDAHVARLLLTARMFIENALALLRRKQKTPLTGDKFLLCSPVLGSGGGGGGDLTGDITKALLTLFTTFVAENDDVDICLVAADEATFVQCQLVRRAMYTKSYTLYPNFSILSEEKKSQAKDLASLASKKELSLFIGAGCSIGAGCPSWLSLLGMIEDKFRGGTGENRRVGAECKWQPLEMADVIEGMCEKGPDLEGRRASLKRRISEIVDRKFSSLLMCLLSALPTRGVITQNYDTLAEIAFSSVNIAERKRSSRPILSVIPYAPVKGAGNWLLKMHGCVSEPEDIVITSKDFEVRGFTFR